MQESENKTFDRKSSSGENILNLFYRYRTTSVADPACFIPGPDPNIFSFRIPDPDQNIFNLGSYIKEG
jgi:hypothetical protein